MPRFHLQTPAQWLCLACSLMSTLPVFGHGSMEYPRSRVRQVRETVELPSPPPWTVQAVAADGSNAYYTWAQLSRNFVDAANGNSQPYYDNIPDGQLASGGNNLQTANLPGHPGLSFSGLDAVSNAWEWPTTPVTEGPMTMQFLTSAAHDPSFFKVWITKPTYNHRSPLKWSDLEYLGQPTHTFSNGSYYFTVNLPPRTGHHIIYCLWQRIDPAGEVFISTSDVQFGGVSDEPPTLSLTSPVTVQESGGNALVTASLSSPAPAGGVTADFTTVAGTAGSADFTPTSGTLNFAAGQIQKTITVPITNDTEAESDEVFTVKLSNIAGADGGQLTSTVTIKDNDTPVGAGSSYIFTVLDSWSTGWTGKLEVINGGPVDLSNWTVEFDAPWPLTPGNVYEATMQPSDGTPYVFTPPSWDPVIGAGAGYSFNWVVNGSTDMSPPTNVKVNGQMLTAAAPAVAIDPVTQPEGDAVAGAVNLTVTLERAGASAIHVAYATLDGTAVAGTDYTATSGSLVFAPGEISKTISVPYAGNLVSERVKTFTVSLAGVSGQTPPRFVAGKQSALVSLTDDDGAPTVLLTGDSLLEGNSGSRDATFRLRLSRAPKAGEAVSLDYATASGTATSGIDFSPRNGTLTFNAGQTEATVTVPVLGDGNDEHLELFYLTLSTFTGCVPITTTATGQIIDDDMPAHAYGNQRVVAYLDMTTGTVNLPPADRVTHLMAAFANVNPDGTLAADSVASWKTALPNVKILLSVGGWTWSSAFTAVANSSAKRLAFAQSCRQYVQANGIDGIDLDWEWPGGGNTSPNANDRTNFTALVHAVRQELNTLSTTTGKTYELTCYAPALSSLLDFWDLAALKNDFNFFNVQGYDLHGTWDNQTNHQSALYPNPSGPDDNLTISEILAVYEAAGVPRSQLLVGAPFYGQVWNNAGPTANGLFQTATGSHTPTYATLAASSARTHLRVWDTYAKVPFLYDALGTGQWTTYDDPQALYEKAAFSIAKGYAGVFFWQIGGDTADHQLLTSLSDSLAQSDPNLDQDTDGLPDAWEIQYYGAINKVDADSDTDGDGASSSFELLSHTDPTDILSVLRGGLHNPGTDNTIVGFDSQSGVKYRIERSFDLGDWVPLQTITGDGHHFHYPDASLPANTPQAFYRIVPLP